MYQLQNWLIQEEDQMTKQVRWKCAICDHGLLAPTKPRKNDVRRYCLPCSSKSGKLVERVAPSLEKQREQQEGSSQEKECCEACNSCKANCTNESTATN
jgi:hypothetical protein